MTDTTHPEDDHPESPRRRVEQMMRRTTEEIRTMLAAMMDEPRPGPEDNDPDEALARSWAAMQESRGWR
jgi:hypothetical protein